MTYADLRSRSGGDETFDDVVSGLLDGRRATVSAGVGLWEGSGVVEAACAARAELKQGRDVD